MRMTAPAAAAFAALAAAVLMLGAVPEARAQFSVLGLKNSLVQFVLSQVSVEGSFEITADRVEEPEDGVTELVDVAISDGEGVWFRADALRLGWNASRVLRGQLEINELVVRGMEVLRAPTPPEVQVKEGSELDQATFDLYSWPRLPITTRVERLAFENAFIAGGVIAEPSLRFDAEGSFRDEGDVQAADLEVVRTDDVEGRIALDYLRNFADESLNLSLEAHEAPGGITAALAGLPEDSASSLDLQADGPLSDWTMTLIAEAEDVVTVSGGALLDARAPIGAQAQLAIAPGPELPESVRTALGEQAELALRVQETAEGRVQIERGDFQSPSLGLQANGVYDRGSGRMDFDLTLEAREQLAALVEGVDFERIGFDGRFEGTPEDFEARGDATLTGLSTAPADLGEAHLEVVAGRQGPAISLTADGQAREVRLDRMGPDLLGETQLSVQADYALDAQRAELERLEINSPLLSVSASGTAELGAERVDLSYSLSTPDLAPVAGAYDVEAAGRLSAEGQVAGPLSAPRLTGAAQAADLSFRGQDWGRVRVTHDVTAGEVVQGTVSAEAEGTPYGPASVSTAFALEGNRLSLSDLQSQALEATVEGAAEVDLETMLAEGRLDLSAPRLDAAGEQAGLEMSGSARGRVELTPVDGTQTVAADLSTDGLSALGASVESARIEATLRDALGAPSATFSARAQGLAAEGARVAELSVDGEAGDLTGAPTAQAEAVLRGVAGPEGTGSAEVVRLDLSGEDLLAAASGRAELTVETIRAAGGVEIARLTATAQGKDLRAAPSGQVDLTAETIRAGGAEIARLTATAKGEDLIDAPRGSASAQARNLRLGEGLSVALVTLEAQGEDLMADPQGAAEIAAQEVKLAGMGTLARLGLTAEGSAADLALRLQGRGETASGAPLTLAAAASGALDGETPALQVRELRLEAGDATLLRLREPLQVTRVEDAWRLEGLNLALPGGGLTGGAALHPAGATGDLRLDVDDLRRVGDLVDLPVQSGAIRLTADFDTRPGSAQAALDVRGTDLVLSDLPDAAGALELDASTRWDGQVMRLDGTLSGPFEQPMRLQASHPLVPSGGPLPQVPEGAGLNAGLEWSGRVETFWALVPFPDHVLRGDLTLDLRLSGSLTAPQLAGEVRLRDGAYQNLMTGTILTELEVTSELAPGGGLVLDLRATDGAGAPVRAEVQLDAQRVEATLSAEEAVLVRRDDVTAALTLDLRAEGPLTAPLVSGDVLVDRAEVRLVSATPPSLTTLDVEVKGAPREPRGARREAGPRLDLDVQAPGNIFVRGRGLQSEWQMDLQVRGRASSPRITGTVSRSRGRLDFLGRQFDLVRGMVRFNGGPEIDPLIDIALENQRADVVGRIALRGTVSDPELAFESDPALPEDEVLPRVIFGRPRQSLTASQAIQLGSGVATLMSGREGVLGQVRSAVGLDVLSVDTEEDSTALRAGRNVADGVFVGVKQPVSGGSPAIEVEVEVIDNVTVDAETGGEAGAAIGATWSYDF